MPPADVPATGAPLAATVIAADAMLRFFPAAPQRRAFLFLGLLLLGLLAAGTVWYARAVAGAAPAPTGGEAILLKLADNALHERRLVAPVGSNVYEFYSSVLQLDPRNALAKQRLREAFAPACAVVERTMDRGDLDEAQRELRLLHEYAPDDYTLLLLGGKLGEHRAMQARQHEQEAERIRMQAGAGGGGAVAGQAGAPIIAARAVRRFDPRAAVSAAA